MNGVNKNILLAAGGTGGHLHGAQSVALELDSQGCNVYLLTDRRVESLIKGFKLDNIKEVSSASFTNERIYKWPLVFARLLFGFVSSLIWIKKFKPKLVIGFGGYPTVPVILAAKVFGLKIIIHEQNMILGRANKLLANLADIITLGFIDASGVSDKHRDKTSFSGNPIRHELINTINPYKVFSGSGKFMLIIFGGSQGASFFSKTIPASLKMLSSKKRLSLEVFHQVRPEEVQNIKNFYNSNKIIAEVSCFFDNLPALLNSSHLIISRSGASTVSEIAAIGRPAIFIPLPHSIDNDQKLNASLLEKSGQAIVQKEKEANSDWFYKTIDKLIDSPDTLIKMNKKTNVNKHKNGAANIGKIVRGFLN
jgi:UDP-N-acetylglucosamine--N-acetylmuramyl-(pentapeptide) pyrophosphoryl-undecaprenol N-acetylglucosamine transferase